MSSGDLDWKFGLEIFIIPNQPYWIYVMEKNNLVYNLISDLRQVHCSWNSFINVRRYPSALMPDWFCADFWHKSKDDLGKKLGKNNYLWLLSRCSTSSSSSARESPVSNGTKESSSLSLAFFLLSGVSSAAAALLLLLPLFLVPFFSSSSLQKQINYSF